MTLMKIGNLKGPKGDPGAPGVPGTFASASAETVPADESAAVVMSGPETAKQVHFKVPRGLPGVNAVPADEAVAVYVGADDTDSGAAVMERVRSRQIMLDVRDFGAAGDGVTDDTAAIQAAFNAADAAPGNVGVFMQGSFLTSAPLTTRSQMDGTQATIEYTGTGGVALTIGVANATTARRTFHLPRLVCRVNTQQKAWRDPLNGPILTGVKLLNIDACKVYSQFIQHFDEGMVLEGNTRGCDYNEVHPGTLWGNRRQLVLSPVNAGWVNSNHIHGGRAQINNRPDISSNGWGIMNDPDASALVLDNKSGSGPNNNSINDLSVEGHNADLYRAIISGRYNQLNNIRWESPGEPLQILWKSTASTNDINGGYNALNLVEVFEPGAVNCHIKQSGGAFYYRANAVAATTVAAGDPLVLTTWTATNGRKATYDPATGRVTPRQGRWRVFAKIHVSGNASNNGTVTLSLLRNGTAVDHSRIAAPTVAGSMDSLTVEMTEDFSGSDTFSVQVTTTSTTGVSLVSSANYCRFHAEYIS